MQAVFPFQQSSDLGSIRERLAARFGRIRNKERPDPVRQFVSSFIGCHTQDWKSWDASARLMQRYQSWDAVADAPVADIEAALDGVTYSEKKAPGLRQALRAIRARHGQINLDFLAEYDAGQALNCLKQIHGVGIKIAAATLNFSALRMHTFVVDTHVLRVLQRFGFVGVRADAETAHDAVMAAAHDLNPDDLFELHWQLKSLGQTICTRAKPLCMSCPLSDICRRSAGNLTALKTFLDKPELENAPIRTPLGHGEADLCLRGGVRRGALHEVFAVAGHEVAATGFTAGLATRVAANKHTLWIRQDFSAHEYGELSATGLFEFGFDPARLLLLAVSNAGDGLRAANDALSCSALGALVIEIPGTPKVLDLVASRRLTLSATKKFVTPFLLRFNAPPDASTAETRWLVRAAISRPRENDWGYPAFEASLVRNRNGKTGHWFMEWNCDECVFQKATADHGAMVSAAAD